MSEQRSNAAEQKPQKGFMAELDAWAEKVIIEPLKQALIDVERAPEKEFREEAEGILITEVAVIKKAIREKVLESYRNGQAAGPRKEQQTPQRSQERPRYRRA